MGNVVDMTELHLQEPSTYDVEHDVLFENGGYFVENVRQTWLDFVTDVDRMGFVKASRLGYLFYIYLTDIIVIYLR